MEPPFGNDQSSSNLSQSGPRPPPPISPLPSPTSLSTSSGASGAIGASALGLSLTNLFPAAAAGGSNLPALLSASGGNGASIGALLESFVAGNHEFPSATASSGFWEALGSINPSLALTGGLPSPTSLPQPNAGLSLDQLHQVTKQSISSMLSHAFVPPAPTAKRKKPAEWDGQGAVDPAVPAAEAPKRIAAASALGSSDGKAGNLGNSDEVNSWIVGIPSKREREVPPTQLSTSDATVKTSTEDLSKSWQQMFQLRIEQQPAPKSLFIGRRAAPPFRIRATWNADLPVKTISTVRACLTQDSAGNVEIINGEEPLDKEHQATFLNLKFAVGTHQRLTQVYFEATVVTHKGDKFTVWSPSSEPFIVCTNIKQWVKSEGTILKRVVFGEATQVPWEQCSATMQKHFFLTVGSQRGLSPDDFSVIHARLGGQEMVSKSVFSDFWSAWYGPILKLAYQKPGRVLWDKRIIYGFLTSTAAEALLRGANPGVFVVRFSDASDASSSSRPVITFVAQDGNVHHYKLTDKEKKMPFHEFLRTKKVLATVLQPCLPGSLASTSASVPPKRTVMNKEALLRDLRPARARKSSGADADGEEGTDHDMDEVLS